MENIKYKTMMYYYHYYRNSVNLDHDLDSFPFWKLIPECHRAVFLFCIIIVLLYIWLEELLTAASERLKLAARRKPQ